MFANGWADEGQRVYTIPGVSADVMRLIIQYAYTCSVPVTEDNVQDLLEAADYLNIMGLVRTCCSFLEAQLCPENCISIAGLAGFYNCPELKRRADAFVLGHFEEIALVSQEFLELSLEQLSDIIEKDQLDVRQEEVVFQAVLRWISHQPEEREPCISLLLPKVE